MEGSIGVDRMDQLAAVDHQPAEGCQCQQNQLLLKPQPFPAAGGAGQKNRHVVLPILGTAEPTSHRDIACLDTFSISATIIWVRPFCFRRDTSFIAKFISLFTSIFGQNCLDVNRTQFTFRQSLIALSIFSNFFWLPAQLLHDFCELNYFSHNTPILLLL